MKKVLSLMKSTRARLILLLVVSLLIDLLLRLGLADVSVSYFIDQSVQPAIEGREVFFHDPDGVLVNRQISGTIVLRSAFPAFLTDLALGADDCVPEFNIPALSFYLTGRPYCNYSSRLILPGLASKFKPGVPYRYFARVTNFGGPGKLSIGLVQSPLVFTTRMLAYTTALVSLTCLLFGFRGRDRGLLVAFSLGMLVRVSYFFSTELGSRTMDFAGHIQYIHHVMSFWNVPHPNMGWEFHQPPLYYFVMAALIRLYTALSGSITDVALTGQALSFIFSAITLAFILKILSLIPVPTARARHWINLLMVTVVTFPNLVFCTMRINNDGMLFALVAYVLYLILRMASGGEHASLFTKIWTSVAGILIKGNGILIVLFWLLTDFVRPGPLRRLERLKSTALVVLIFVLFSGAQTSFRYQQNAYISPFYRDSSGLTPELKIGNKLENFLTFNPVRVFYDTYTDPWSEVLHRSIFWENLIRNFLFGEFNHGPYLHSIGRLMISLWMCIIGFMLFQVLTAPPSRIFGIALLLLFVSFVMFIGFRVSYPFSSHQDARFLPPLFVILPFLLGERMVAFYQRRMAGHPALDASISPVWETLLSSVIVVQLAFLLWLP